MCDVAKQQVNNGKKYVEVQLNNKRVVIGPVDVSTYSIDLLRRRIESEFGSLFPSVLVGEFTINFKTTDGMWVRVKREDSLRAALRISGDRVRFTVDIPFGENKMQHPLPNNTQISSKWNRMDCELASMANFSKEIHMEFIEFKKKRIDTLTQTLLNPEIIRKDHSVESALSGLETDADELEAKVADLEFKQCVFTSGLDIIETSFKTSHPLLELNL